AEQDQRAEADRPSLQRHLERLRASVRVAGSDERAARPDEDAPGSTGGLDRTLDDQAHQLLGVVRRAEGLAETRGDVAQAPALSLELVQTRLELEGHLVERATEQRKFVSTLNGHTLLQVPARDCGSSVD